MVMPWGQFQGKLGWIWREVLLPAGGGQEGRGFEYLGAVGGPDTQITAQALRCHASSVPAWAIAAQPVLSNQQRHVHPRCLAVVRLEEKPSFPGCSLGTT